MKKLILAFSVILCTSLIARSQYHIHVGGGARFYGGYTYGPAIHFGIGFSFGYPVFPVYPAHPSYPVYPSYPSYPQPNNTYPPQNSNCAPPSYNPPRDNNNYNNPNTLPPAENNDNYIPPEKNYPEPEDYYLPPVYNSPQPGPGDQSDLQPRGDQMKPYADRSSPGNNNEKSSIDKQSNNSKKIWIAPHWKQTGNGQVWIEGYWKKAD